MNSSHTPRLRTPSSFARLHIVTLALLLGATTPSHAQQRQSPVDINPFTTVGAPLPTIARSYQVANVTVVNTYNPAAVPPVPEEFATLRVNVPAGSSITVNNVVYDLAQFHFHAPSEHTVLGVHAPMEVHFVHVKRGACLGDGDALLVIGALILRGPQNAELQKIFGRTLPVDSNSPALAINGFDLTKVLPAGHLSWRYAGSLTAPSNVGCNNPAGSVATQLATNVFPENVSWVVLEQPIFMSLAQIRKFQALFSFMGNARETQPLNGRTVFRDQLR